MTEMVRLWTSAAFDDAYLCGGWAAVRLVGTEPAGFAGGERRTTARRMLLTSLGAGLRGIPAAGAVRIETESADAKDLAAILSGSAPGPEDDLDLWAPILTACRGRTVTVAAASLGPDTPVAFAGAWAELSRDKAKMKGPFTAAIPRANVAQVAWPR
jgi:hypothetical protein